MEIKFERDCREFQFVKFVRKEIYCAITKIVHRKINLCYNFKDRSKSTLEKIEELMKFDN